MHQGEENNIEETGNKTSWHLTTYQYDISSIRTGQIRPLKCWENESKGLWSEKTYNVPIFDGSDNFYHSICMILLKTDATKIRFLSAWEDKWFLPSLTWNAPGKLLCFIHHSATPSKAPKVHKVQTCFVSRAVNTRNLSPHFHVLTNHFPSPLMHS